MERAWLHSVAPGDPKPEAVGAVRLATTSSVTLSGNPNSWDQVNSVSHWTGSWTVQS